MEQDLEQDLVGLAEPVQGDASFAEELYRGLANRTWHRPGSGTHVSLSWGRAEAIVNHLRSLGGRDALTLAQTGGEGEVTDRVEQALQELGWSSRPLDTSRHDDRHVDRPGDAAPPASEGAAGGTDWERQAHAEADRSR